MAGGPNNWYALIGIVPLAGREMTRPVTQCHCLRFGANVDAATAFPRASTPTKRFALNGLDGHHSGSVANYSYSDANKNSGIVWNEETLKGYIKDPKEKISGTK